MKFVARLAAASLLVLVPSAASAASTEGSGVNVRHLRNIPHTVQATPRPTKNQGTDLELATIGERTYAFAGSYYQGLDIIDVTDPQEARIASSYDCGIGQGDVQVFRRDGGVYVAYAQDDGYAMQDSTCVREAKALGFSPNSEDGGIYIIDVTDPLHPRLKSFVAIGGVLVPGTTVRALAGGSHNSTVHPSGMYIYNSNADLMASTLPAVEIVSLADLGQPEVVAEFPLKTVPGLGTEAHDITFNADGTRAYVAALSHGEVLDTTDPAAPRSLLSIVDPSLNVWHQMEAITLEDPILGERDFLIAEDEFAGAEHTGQCPNGGIHVYDITGESAAVPVGVFNIDEARTTDPTSTFSRGRCTAHVFQIDPRSKILTMGWYSAGVRVLDLSALAGVGIAGRSPVGIRQLGYFQFRDTDAWAAKTLAADRSGFYVFANDKRRGFDVYRYEPPATRRAKREMRRTDGRWSTPAQAARRFKHVKSSERPTLAGLCFVAPR